MLKWLWLGGQKKLVVMVGSLYQTVTRRKIRYVWSGNQHGGKEAQNQEKSRLTWWSPSAFYHPHSAICRHPVRTLQTVHRVSTNCWPTVGRQSIDVLVDASVGLDSFTHAAIIKTCKQRSTFKSIVLKPEGKLRMILFLLAIHSAAFTHIWIQLN